MLNEKDIQDYKGDQYQQPYEKDPYGKSPHSPGAKLDAGKAACFRGLLAYFPRACESVAAVSTFGASKYAWKGWESVPSGFERYSDAMVRHLIDEGSGESQDPDSELPHAAHTAWNALARLELLLREDQPQQTKDTFLHTVSQLDKQ